MGYNGKLLKQIMDNLDKPGRDRTPKNKKKKPIVSSRGQWDHPGQRTIVPTPDGRITMMGVPYPVYGQDETGYGQMMYPGQDYQFPGQMVDEHPMMQNGGQMIRRADGSYSRRGLWDNIRANKGSGKKPTKEMLKQERNIKAKEMKNGGTNNPGFVALPAYVQANILSNMGYGGMTYPFMQQGGEPDGGMALGQIAAVMDKMSKLAQFIRPESDLEPWVSSKLSVMDHYADAVSDYMNYNPEAQGEMGEMMGDPQGLPMPEMRNGGGIPERYKNMGFNKVGVKKDSTRSGKKWMVLAKKGDQYKVVHGGYDGMKDYSQHGSDKRKENFWNRMGGKNSSKATDPFSSLYWHKKFGTWQEGGEIPEMKGGGSTWSGNTWYQDGGSTLLLPRQDEFPDYESYAEAMDEYHRNYATIAASIEQEQLQMQQMQQAAEHDASNAPMHRMNINSPKSINYQGPSVVDMLTSIGKASDYNSRKQLAAELGISNYYGSAEQNMQLMRKIQKDPSVIDDYKAVSRPRSVSGAGAKPRTTAAAAKPAAQPTSMFTPAFFEKQKQTYISAHPEITPAQYDAMTMGSRNVATVGPASKPLPAGPERDPIYFDDSYTLNQIKKDPGTRAAKNREKRKDFATNLAVGTIAPWLAEGALMAATTRYLPYGLRALPQVTAAARHASKALPYATRALPYQQGGFVAGDEMDVTPEQLEMLRAQGYQFEMI